MEPVNSRRKELKRVFLDTVTQEMYVVGMIGNSIEGETEIHV